MVPFAGAGAFMVIAKYDFLTFRSLNSLPILSWAFDVFRKNQNTADGAVQSMNGFGKNTTGFPVRFPDVGLDYFLHRRISCFVTLSEYTTGFIHNEQVIVLIKNWRHLFNVGLAEMICQARQLIKRIESV